MNIEYEYLTLIYFISLIYLNFYLICIYSLLCLKFSFLHGDTKYLWLVDINY